MDEQKKKDVEAFVSTLFGEAVEMPMLNDETEANVQRALESFNKADRSFACIACGDKFTPAKDQWIFHQLCDRCFVSFDGQKMCGRFPSQCKHAAHFESAPVWAKDVQKRFLAHLGPEIARIEQGGDLPKRFEGRTREECLSNMRNEFEHFKIMVGS